MYNILILKINLYIYSNQLKINIKLYIKIFNNIFVNLFIIIKLNNITKKIIIFIINKEKKFKNQFYASNYSNL